MWDQIIRWAEFLASIATVVAIIIAALTYFGERRRRAQERQEERRSLLLALQGDVTGLCNAIEIEDKAYQRAETEEFRLHHVWASLGSPMLEAALRQPYLLSLNSEEIADIIFLRVIIQRTNACVNAKEAVVIGLAAGAGAEVTLRQAASLDARIRELLPSLKRQAENILRWTSAKLKDEPAPVTAPP
jgi:hypothetical protein